MVRGIGIVYLYAADLGRAIAFYERAFGLSFMTHGDDWAACTLADGTRFGFHLAHDGEAPQTPRAGSSRSSTPTGNGCR